MSVKDVFKIWCELYGEDVTFFIEYRCSLLFKHPSYLNSVTYTLLKYIYRISGIFGVLIILAILVGPVQYHNIQILNTDVSKTPYSAVFVRAWK
jgi:hypothetical protein